MEEQGVSEASIIDSLGAAFGDTTAAPPPKPAAPEPEPADEPIDAQDALPEPSEDDDGAPLDEQEAVATKVAAEPEFEIEINGRREVVRGKDAIRELLQKGKDSDGKYSEAAQLKAQATRQWQLAAMAVQFNQSVVNDQAELRALDAQLGPYEQINWMHLFDSDPVQALKYQQQRNALKEARAAKVAELERKQHEFGNQQANALAQIEAAEEQALRTRAPIFADPAKAPEIKAKIVNTLLTKYGFTQAELANKFDPRFLDHRVVMAFNDAMRFHELKAAMADKAKQVRTAPQAVKPGVASTAPQGKVAFQKTRAEIRKAGRQGNHRAQEQLVTGLLERAFK